MPLPTTLKQIAETEAALGATFPAVFKLRMCRSNGGSVDVAGETWFLFPFRDASNRASIRRTAAGDIGRETKEAIDADLGFPQDGIAIASNGAGDLLFLRRDGNRVRDEVWCFRLHGGEVDVALDDIADLWERADDA